jgi:hypothetical protein
MNSNSHKRLRKSYDKKLTGSPSKKKKYLISNIYSIIKNYLSNNTKEKQRVLFFDIKNLWSSK